ncbi:CAMP-dependent protein kinase regulatory subunit [Plakobranchus ocellatus]|uniref:cAMP-dependent protein kinase regulatory subunit n=1 Tax=Plakobranchus ocellatus TaxID=259542 RepID=A0AAV4AHX0_9GAST|nr:CAMP-dependent protein kinase regulatory subunit [Plakobranchus ocellatus]
MSPKFKHLLELSLRKAVYPFDSILIKQGEPATSLFFILSGQANMFVEPSAYQKQYPHMWPFEAGIDLYSQEFEWLRESRKNAILRKYEDPAVWPTKSEHLVVKRTEGYAAAEKRMQDRSVCLCSIHEGEVLGDLEVSTKLQTYASSVWCTAPVTALVLDLKNLERVVGRRNPVTMEVIRSTAQDKLAMRTKSRQGRDVTFLNFLLCKMTEERLPSAKKLPPIKAAKQLPTKDIQVQHLLEKFKEGQAELIEPIIPGALIYKEQMQEKARIRSNVRKRSTIGVSAMLREARRKMNRRQPRSRREIVESLREMMESDLVEYTKPAGVPANPSELPSRNSPKPDSPDKRMGASQSRKGSLIENPLLKSVRFQEAIKSSSTPDNKERSRRSSLVAARRGSEPKAPPEVAASPRRGSKEAMDKLISQSPRIQAKKKKSGPPPPSLEKTNSLILPAIAEAPRELSNMTAASVHGGKNPKLFGDKESGTAKQSQTNTPRASLGELVQRQLSGAGASTESGSASSKLEYKRTEVPATSKSPTRLPPLAKPELKKPDNVSPTKWQSALQFVNERINDRFTKQLLEHGPGFDDYETSDVSLNVLENRIRTFFTKQIQTRQDLKLPPLRRFKLDLENADVSLPKPGGKVWIRKRLCRFANSEIKVKNHEHVRYHMVPELPQFDHVKKTRVIMHHLLSGNFGKGNTPQSNSPRKMAAGISARNSFSET